MINLRTPPIFDDEDKTLIAHHLFIIVWTFMGVGWLAIFIAEAEVGAKSNDSCLTSVYILSKISQAIEQFVRR